jgi:hypothetical protein
MNTCFLYPLFLTLAVAQSADLQTQTLDGRLTVHVPELMTEYRAAPDPFDKQESVRLWVYKKGDILFVVTETHYKPGAI